MHMIRKGQLDCPSGQTMAAKSILKTEITLDQILQAAPALKTGQVQPLGDIANVEKMIPRDWLSVDGLMPNKKMIDYARPLIEGTVRVPVEGGLPKFVVLKKTLIAKKLPERGYLPNSASRYSGQNGNVR